MLQKAPAFGAITSGWTISVRSALAHQPERAHGGVAVQGDQVVGEREV